MALVDHAHGGPATTAPVGLASLAGMAAAFTTNAAVGVRSIASIDGVSLGR